MVEDALKTFAIDDIRPVKIFFQDEAIFGRINKTVACWAPEKIRPLVSQQKIRQYLYVYTVVCPMDGENFSLILPSVNAGITNLFFEHVAQAYKDFRCIIIMDKAPWHSPKLLAKFDNIRFIPLPPYSPELNGAEHFWEHIREKYFRNQDFKSLDHLEDALVDALEEARNDIQIIQSLVGFHWIENVTR